MTVRSLHAPLYEVEHIEVNPQGGASVIRLNPQHAVYRGHFPADPITPGACLIQIGANLVKGFLPVFLPVTEITNAKFLQIIRPHQYPIRYDWTIRSASAAEISLQFKVWSDQALAAQFSIVLKNTIQED